MSCAKTCDCNEQMINTKTGCISSRAVEKRAWVVNRTKADGSLNYIDLTSDLDDAYFMALFNHVDKLERVFPLPEIKDINDVRDKSVMIDAKDGTQFKVRDGIRKFEGVFYPPFSSPQMVAILQAQRCASPCKWSVDANGTIWGRISEDGTKLYPMRMDAGSVDVIYQLPTDTDIEKVNYSFNLHPSERDCTMRGLEASELADDIIPLDYDGLMDVFMKVVSCSTEKLVVELYDGYGKITNPEAVTDFLAANFALYNITDSSAIALTGSGAAFAEAPAGTYSLTFATADQPTSADELALTPTKDGFDCTAVSAVSIIVS